MATSIKSTSSTLDLGYHKIAIKTYGNNNNFPTLAIHGWLDNADSFANLAPVLNDLYIIAIDLTGHGLSEHRKSDTYLHTIDYIFDMISIANALNLEKFNLLGHSLGGALCCLLAGSYPNRINKLALIDAIGPVVHDLAKGPCSLYEATEQLIKNTKSSPTYTSIDEAIDARLKAKIGTMLRSSAETLVPRSLTAVKDGYIWSNDPRLVHTNPMYISEEQFLPFLQNISAKTCFIEPIDGFPFGSTYVEKRIAAVKNIAHHRVPGHHHVHLDDPVLVATILNDFFK